MDAYYSYSRNPVLFPELIELACKCCLAGKLRNSFVATRSRSEARDSSASAQVFDDLSRGICARRPGYATARMRSGAAKI